MGYIYNPRVANEPLVAYKKFFAEAVPQALQSKFRSSIEALRQWCVSTIRIDNSHNPLTYPIEPIGVWKSQKADTHSRDIFFVSLARTMGWPTRIDGVTGKVQVYEQDAWHDVVLDKGLSQTPSSRGLCASATRIMASSITRSITTSSPSPSLMHKVAPSSFPMTWVIMGWNKVLHGL